MAETEVEVLENETCMFCHNNTLALTATTMDIPYFGLTHILTMECSSCNYKKTDVESEEEKEPAKFTLDVESEEDLKIRVVKSSSATVKIPYVGEIEPGEASSGYVTNIEGVFNRFKDTIESMKEESDDDSEKKKAKNLLKKINRILWGRDKAKVIIEDPTGNSAIISDKAKKEKLK